jgi:glucose/arabinose dehydrogenase
MTTFLAKKKTWFGICLLMLPFFLTFVTRGSVRAAVVDSDDTEITVQFAPGETVDLKLKAEPGEQIWVLIEVPSLYAGIQFARPNDPYSRENGRYLFSFSVEGELTADAPNLFFAESFGTTRIDFGKQDITGLEELIITTRKGNSPDALETIQRVRLVEMEWPQISVNLYASGLGRPVQITHAGDGSGRLFVVSQSGRIEVLQNGVMSSAPFLDITDRVLFGGEQGLLSMAFPPNFSNSHFYVYYTDLKGDNVVARCQVSDDPNSAFCDPEKIVLTISHPEFENHNGGQLVFGPDGYLYIGTGDGGGAGDPGNNAQDPRSFLGKILRLDVEAGDIPYAIPPTNPFTGPNDPSNIYLDEIWALGLRNPWRFSFDRQTGDLYIGDVGQNTYEEIDFQPASSMGGENYGWNIMEGFHCFNAESCDQTGLILPVVEYDHTEGNSVTGGFVYRGSDYPRMQGIYFYGDFTSGAIWGLRNDGTTWQNALLLESGLSISAFGEDEKGNLYVTNYFSGDIYLITDSPG